MASSDNLEEVITQKPEILNKPYFYKADSDATNQLEQLQEFYKTAQIGRASCRERV